MPTYDADILPSTTGRNLGSSVQRWDGYLQQLDVSGVTTFSNPISADIVGNITGNVTGNLTGNVTGDVTSSGTSTFSTENVKNLNSIRFADQFTGADAAAKINAAIADLPSTGGIVDARGLTGAQTCSTNPFSGVTKSVQLWLGFSTFTSDFQWLIPGKCQVIGSGRGDAGSTGTVIKASAAFPVNTAVVQLGDSLVSRAFATRVENLTIDCNNITGSIGIYSDAANEQSGARRVLIVGALDAGIRTSSATALLANYILEDIEINISTGSSAAILGLDLVGGANANDGTIRNLTANFFGSTKVTTAVSAKRFVGIIDHLHIENATTGLLIVGTALGGGNACYRNITGNTDVTTLVKISSAFPQNGIVLQNIEPFGSTNTLVDDFYSRTVSGDQISSYIHGTNYVEIIQADGKGTFFGGIVVGNIAAPTVAANQLGLGSTTATTVGAAGGASALPATPTGYLIVNIAGTNFKIPYYAS